jgi:H+/Cl- antiporter ClcA
LTLLKLAALWVTLLVPPFIERTLLGARTYYFLYIGLGLVFAIYGVTVHKIFFFLRHVRREPVYVWIAFLYGLFLFAAFWQDSPSNTISCRTRQNHRLLKAAL